MFNKERYKQEVFNKYQNEIDNINLKKRNNKIKSIPTFILIGFIAIGITVAAYTGNEIYKKNIKQNSKIIENDLKYDYSSKMRSYDEYGIFYQIIDSYSMWKEYNLYWGNLPDMNENEFKEEFLLAIFSLESKRGLQISDISSENNETYIVLENESIDKEQNLLFTKISKEYINNHFNFEIIPGTSEIGKYGYTLMKNIDEKYILGQDFKEGCIIIDHWNIVSNNQDKIYSFVESTKENINSGIRFVKTGDFEGETKFVIIDVVYYENNYYVCVYNYNRNIIKEGGAKVSFFKVGDVIELDEIDNYGLGIYIHKSNDNRGYAISFRY